MHKLIATTIEGGDVSLGDKQPFGVKSTGSANTVGSIIGNVLLIMFIVGGLAVVVYFVWGALDYILAGGDKERIGSARKKMTNSLIGLALLALSFFIITVVGDVVGFNPLQGIAIPQLGEIVTQTPSQPQTPSQ